jgi:hypothetical protein
MLKSRFSKYRLWINKTVKVDVLIRDKQPHQLSISDHCLHNSKPKTEDMILRIFMGETHKGKPVLMPMKTRRRISFFTVLIDLLIDLAFMLIGFLVYYHFLVSPLFFVEPTATVVISPLLTIPVGGFTNAVYILAGIPFLIGFLGLLQLIIRLILGLTAAARST